MCIVCKAAVCEPFVIKQYIVLHSSRRKSNVSTPNYQVSKGKTTQRVKVEGQENSSRYKYLIIYILIQQSDHRISQWY